MRGALIHGLLLAVMLIYGYRTWTRDKTVKPDRGSVVLWNKGEAEIASIEYKTDKKTVLLEQRKDADGGYWWGTDTTIDKRPKPPEKKPEPAPGAGSGSAAAPGAGSGSAAVAAGSGSGAGSGSAAVAAAGSGSGAGSGSAATPPPVVMEEVKKTTEYPVGEGGKKLLEGYFEARALRDLGVPNDKAKKDYKLDAATTTLTVAFRDNTKRTFLVGGSVFNTSGGSSDRYVMEKESGKAYVFAQLMLGSLEIGQSSLHLQDPRGFDPTKIAEVAIQGPGYPAKTIVRVTAASTEGAPGATVKTWGDAATKKPNTTLANFIDNASGLRPTEYKAQLKIESLAPVASLTYKDDRGGKLGTLSLYKLEKPGELTEGQVFDPQNPPRGETEYYIVTEKTRVPGLVRKDAGQRVEQDMPMVFSANPPAEPKKPAENPFANTPIPAREKTPPTPPGGAPPAAGSGSAAPAAGSAAPGAPKAPMPAPAAGSAAPAAGSAAPKPGAHDGHGH